VSRLLGVDLGARRIGLAVSDPSETLASPLAVLERVGDRSPHPAGDQPGDQAGDRAVDHRAILATAREEGVARIVVGLPRSLSGDEGPAARAARAEALELQRLAGADLPVELHDERFTTVTATRRLRESRRGAAKREPVDAAAAAEMLQSYLDALDAGRRARRNR
jgi:putative Holliday junction resolvase